MLDKFATVLRGLRNQIKDVNAKVERLEKVRVIPKDGTDGERGPDGPTGATGASVTSVRVEENRVLVAIDGVESEAGSIDTVQGDKGEPGRDGKSVTDVKLKNNELFVAIDGKQKSAGKIEIPKLESFTPSSEQGGSGSRLLLKTAGNRNNHYFPAVDNKVTEGAKNATGLLTNEGLTSVPTVVDNGDGTVNISNVEGHIRSGSTSQDPLVWFEIPAANYPITLPTSQNYFVAKYNGGSPVIVVQGADSPVTDGSEILAAIVTVSANVVEISPIGYEPANRLGSLTQAKDFEVRPFEVVTPPDVREVGVLNLAASTATFWAGSLRFDTPDWDTTRGGPFDNFSYWYREAGGAWSQTIETQVDNQQYNPPAGGLATLGSNRYGVHWLYMTANGFGAVVYGNGSFSLNDAIALQPPEQQDLPPFALEVATLAAKIVVQKGALVFTEINDRLAPSKNFIPEELSTKSLRHETFRASWKIASGDPDTTQLLLADNAKQVITFSDETASSPVVVSDLGNGVFQTLINADAQFTVAAEVTRQQGGGDTEWGMFFEYSFDGAAWLPVPDSLRIVKLKSTENNDIEHVEYSVPSRSYSGAFFRVCQITNDSSKQVGIISSQPFGTSIPVSAGVVLSIEMLYTGT